MRGYLAVFAGLGFSLSNACGGTSGSTTSSGTATGGSTMGGATSAGTTGTGTTIGTSAGTSSGTTGTGGGGLLAGAVCSGDTQCRSGVCGINGNGRCCNATCTTLDSRCGGPTSCDETGACTYAFQPHCGTDSCDVGQLTQSHCSDGRCVAYPTAPCPNDLACHDATSCNTRCDTAADCISGFYCDTSSHLWCFAQQATGHCTSDDACSSGVCDLAGSGNCCLARCATTTDLACNPSGCDATTGACVYAAGAVCARCTGSTLTVGTCDAPGVCGHTTAVACPYDLVCDRTSPGACLEYCWGPSDCVSGFTCHCRIVRGGRCALGYCGPTTQATGACTSNHDCTSGICGATGTGHCCTKACVSGDPMCGYTDCDDTGACVYPDSTTVCDDGGSCVGSTLTDPARCDGAGSCVAPTTTTDCAPYTCGPSACLTACASDGDCTSGHTCDANSGACLPQ